nr:15179_t:CDS:2 [Entrophospora candida]
MDTHVYRCISPAIDPFFHENGKIKIEANLMTKSSATTNRKFDPCLLGSKPDFTVMTTKPGFIARVYVLDLCYDGIYCMFLLGEFCLPDRAATWGNLGKSDELFPSVATEK